MNLNCPARADEGLLHRLLFVSILSKSLFPLPSLQDDVDVASDEGADVFALSGLHTVVLVLVVAKVEGEDIRRGSPALHSGQRPRLQDLLGLLVQPEHGVLRHPEQAWHQLVSAFLLLLQIVDFCVCW